MDIIKVSGTSRTSAVAGAIAGVVREKKRAEIPGGPTYINIGFYSSNRLFCARLL
jgi:stage V sporulation protein SpoVS